uniref:Collagen triple helix repeat-containing protein n=1 Tax=Candidatus Kentrum sp. TUN TaxID=2126343 RepID=A0A451A414_9GAMM|nr:MAG: Collagen triple helix repeat-containing protein [Candidatus Kentron sp. TUN]VFK70042.1 MAG: Collagen triple helix repeat-containing protein [Candidatus Kentron sp. TUN]
MKTKTSSYRQDGIALVILLSTLIVPLSAEATEYTATFEATLGGWTAVEDTSIFDWTRRTGGTPSGYTGPSGAHEGEYYLYLDTSYGNTPGKIAYLESPDFSGEAVSGMTFHYHLYGQQMGTLAVETFDGSAWSPVWQITGQQHAGHTSAWTRKQIDLSGQTARKIRFKGITGSGYRGDMAIDQVTVFTGEGSESPATGSWSKSGKHIYYTHVDGGNVGIGTQTPTADLSILGNLSHPLTGHVMVTAGSSAVTGEETRFTQELRVGDSLLIGEEVFLVTKIHGDTALTVDTPSTVGTLNATAYTDSDLLSVQTGAEEQALVVDRTGNVGIGTAAPKAKLDVAGGIRIGNETICDAGKAGTIRYGNGQAVEVCDGSVWTQASGPEGPEGPEGPQGLKGEKGDTGATGPQGIKGDKGDTGATGPQGPRGLVGPIGPRGSQGQKGDKGDLGDSFWSQSGTNISYNDGNVGVGTTSPAEAIEIKDNKPVLSLHEPNVATFKVGSDGGVFKIAAMDNGYGGYTGNFNANDAQILSMTKSGNIGVGTMNPDANLKLDVEGMVGAEQYCDKNGENCIKITDLKNKKIWSTNTAASYSLRDIFDEARQNGLPYGAYDCILKTNNGAHWKGNRFLAIINYYTRSTHSGFPHKYYDIQNLDAGATGGCSEGLTSWLDFSGNFSFSPGNCHQNIKLTCTKLD